MPWSGSLAEAAFPGRRCQRTAFKWMLLIQMTTDAAVKAVPATRAAAGIPFVKHPSLLCSVCNLLRWDWSRLLIHLRDRKLEDGRKELQKKGKSSSTAERDWKFEDGNEVKRSQDGREGFAKLGFCRRYADDEQRKQVFSLLEKKRWKGVSSRPWDSASSFTRYRLGIRKPDHQHPRTASHGKAPTTNL